MKRKFEKLALAALIAITSTSACFAQAYPSRTIRLIVPSAPGGPVDTRARWIAEKLRIALGQALMVDNKPGAAGIIGTQAAMQSAADGYTLIMVHQGTMALNPHLYPALPYDPIKDFAPVSRLVVSPMLLAVNPDVPAHSVADLIRLAKEKPGQLSFGSPGVGSPPHMAGVLFGRLAQIEVLHIPYKSGPPAQIDLIGGRLTYTFEGVVTQLPQVRAGKIRGLAVTSAKRLPALPDIPTVAESGLPGYEYWAWMGIAAPAGTPKAIITRLNAEITKILRTQEARDWFAEQGGEPIIETPEEFAAYIKTEYSRWGKLIREAGIKAE
ncbi:MAG: tripartite tricarboxylate transporter substrate binding protein [Betaproteobacteria bacterium]